MNLNFVIEHPGRFKNMLLINVTSAVLLFRSMFGGLKSQNYLIGRKVLWATVVTGQHSY